MDIGVAEGEMESLTGVEQTLLSDVPLSSSKFTPDKREAREDEADVLDEAIPEAEFTDNLRSNPQDTQSPVTFEDTFGNINIELRVTPEAQEEVGIQPETIAGPQELWGRETEEEAEEGSQNEAGKEQHINGESGLRREGAGRRGRPRNSGGGITTEHTSHTTSSSTAPSYPPKGSLPSSGGRHKQARRRNHHHHQGRGRRRMGTQLALTLRELMSESLSPWCISCIHMVVELIVTVTHHCGVCVETGAVVLYDFGSQLLAKMTDLPGMKADAGRTVDRKSVV